jgi:hypothetical protein
MKTFQSYYTKCNEFTLNSDNIFGQSKKVSIKLYFKAKLKGV